MKDRRAFLTGATSALAALIASPARGARVAGEGRTPLVPLVHAHDLARGGAVSSSART